MFISSGDFLYKTFICTAYSFQVTGLDANGCKNSDTVTPFVGSGNKGGYHLPNAFAAKGDGLNDCLEMLGWKIQRDTGAAGCVCVAGRWGWK